MVYRYMFKKDDYTDYFVILMYKNRKQMYTGIKKYEKENKIRSVIMDGLSGRVYPQNRYDKLGNMLFAVCFLNEEDANMDIISHECLHIAFAHEEQVFCYTGTYSNLLNTIEEQERICYYYGEILRSVMNTLKINKHLLANPYKEIYSSCDMLGIKI